MKRRTSKASALAKRRADREAGIRPKGRSNYARKKAWLLRHNAFGFEVAEPKPWKRGAR